MRVLLIGLTGHLKRNKMFNKFLVLQLNQLPLHLVVWRLSEFLHKNFRIKRRLNVSESAQVKGVPQHDSPVFSVAIILRNGDRQGKKRFRCGFVGDADLREVYGSRVGIRVVEIDLKYFEVFVVSNFDFVDFQEWFLEFWIWGSFSEWNQFKVYR
jgi:hypothetical protein